MNIFLYLLKWKELWLGFVMYVYLKKAFHFLAFHLLHQRWIIPSLSSFSLSLSLLSLYISLSVSLFLYFCLTLSLWLTPLHPLSLSVLSSLSIFYPISLLLSISLSLSFDLLRKKNLPVPYMHPKIVIYFLPREENVKNFYDFWRLLLNPIQKFFISLRKMIKCLQMTWQFLYDTST